MTSIKPGKIRLTVLFVVLLLIASLAFAGSVAAQEEDQQRGVDVVAGPHLVKYELGLRFRAA